MRRLKRLQNPDDPDAEVDLSWCQLTVSHLIVSLVAVLLLLGVAVVLFPFFSPDVERGTSRVKSEVVALTYALRQFHAVVRHPLPKTNAEIYNALLGENASGVVFIDLLDRVGHRTTADEVLDPWGTPYRFDISDPESPRVWSCGKNKRDEGGAEGSDDVVSWRLSR